MGHFLFVVLHIIALLFFFWALIVTIPLHIIYAAMSGPSKPSPRTHVTCPYCREFVHQEASVCPHCRKTLVPASVQWAQQRAARVAAGKKWWQS